LEEYRRYGNLVSSVRGSARDRYGNTEVVSSTRLEEWSGETQATLASETQKVWLRFCQHIDLGLGWPSEDFLLALASETFMWLLFC
jgi:hypothetical protein